MLSVLRPADPISPPFFPEIYSGFNYYDSGPISPSSEHSDSHSSWSGNSSISLPDASALSDESSSTEEPVEPTLSRASPKVVSRSERVLVGGGHGPQMLPTTQLSWWQPFLYSSTLWINNLDYLHNLCLVSVQHPRLNIIRAPRGYGKTTLMSMVSAAQQEQFHEEFMSAVGGHVHCHNAFRERIVLSLNLAGLPTEPRALSQALASRLDMQCRRLQRHHLDPLFMTRDQVDNARYDGFALYYMLEPFYMSGLNIWVNIDNFNAPILNASPTTVTDVCTVLLELLIRPLSDALRVGLVCGGLMVGSLDPEYMEQPSLWDDIAIDLTETYIAEHSLGFALEDAAELAYECLPEDELDGFIEEVCTKLGIESRYSMSDVLALLRARTGQSDEEVDW